jgi:trigger factor
MDIVKQDINELGALLRVQIVKSDYEENLKKSLNVYRRQAEIKGFRTGMAPMSLIQKIYGQSALIEEINKLISKALGEYIENEKLHILGEPIPCDDEQKSIDWDSQSDFEFVYEIGYAPECELKIDDQIQVPFYNITISENEKNKYIDNLRQRYGIVEDSETAGENDIIKVAFSQDCENAIQIDDVFIRLSILDTEQKTLFLGLKIGDTAEIDINTLYKTTEDKVNLLKLNKKDLKTINPKFTITMKQIRTFKKAEINQNFFDDIYGNGNVTSEEEFLQRVTDELTKYYENESDYKFAFDVRNELTKKADLKFPEKFLKKWLTFANEEKLTDDVIDNEFDEFIEDLNWQIICDKILKENDIKVEHDEIKERAIKMTHFKLIGSGLDHLTDSHAEVLAQNLLKNEKTYKIIVKDILEDKIFAYLKTAVTLDKKEISDEEFFKMIEKEI